MSRSAHPLSATEVSWVLIFLGLGFSVAGLTLLLWQGWALLCAWQMRSWVEVPVHILQVELKVHCSDDGPSYTLATQYAYSYQGHDYRSSAVAGGNIPHLSELFRRQVYWQLQETRRSGRTFRGFVNPTRPTEAVLFRELALGQVLWFSGLGLFFACLGGGILWAGCGVGPANRERDHLRAEHPLEPWLWQPDWAAGRIVIGRSGMMTALVVAVIVNTILWFIVPVPLHEGDYRASCALLVGPLVLGSPLAIWTLLELIRWKKYGGSVLELATVPGAIGGSLSGVLRTSVPIRPKRGLRLRLACIHKTTSGASEEIPALKTVWKERQVLTREQLEAGEPLAIPVHFAIPADTAPTDHSNPLDVIYWELEVKAGTPLGYSVTFEVPVFRTPESRAD